MKGSTIERRPLILTSLVQRVGSAREVTRRGFTNQLPTATGALHFDERPGGRFSPAKLVKASAMVWYWTRYGQ